MSTDSLQTESLSFCVRSLHFAGAPIPIFKALFWDIWIHTVGHVGPGMPHDFLFVCFQFFSTVLSH